MDTNGRGLYPVDNGGPLGAIPPALLAEIIPVGGIVYIPNWPRTWEHLPPDWFPVGRTSWEAYLAIWKDARG